MLILYSTVREKGGGRAFSFTHIGRFKIPRPAVTFKQLLNCVCLFTIYAPPLPKLRLTRVRMREFSQPEGIPSGTEALRKSNERLCSDRRALNALPFELCI